MTDTLQDGSILSARWPTAGEINEILIRSSQYLMSAAHAFRILLKNYMTPKKPSKGKADASPTEKPTQGIIWVAKTYPPWQSVVLTTMREMYSVSEWLQCNVQRFVFFFLSVCINVFVFTLQKNGNQLPDNKALATALSGKSELKKYMKRVMPFVQAVKEKVETVGLSALNLTLDFDEFDVLESNKDYLKSTLGVSSIHVIFDEVVNYT